MRQIENIIIFPILREIGQKNMKAKCGVSTQSQLLCTSYRLPYFFFRAEAILFPHIIDKCDKLNWTNSVFVSSLFIFFLFFVGFAEHLWRNQFTKYPSYVHISNYLRKIAEALIEWERKKKEKFNRICFFVRSSTQSHTHTHRKKSAREVIGYLISIRSDKCVVL